MVPPVSLWRWGRRWFLSRHSHARMVASDPFNPRYTYHAPRINWRAQPTHTAGFTGNVGSNRASLSSPSSPVSSTRCSDCAVASRRRLKGSLCLSGTSVVAMAWTSAMGRRVAPVFRVSLHRRSSVPNGFHLSMLSQLSQRDPVPGASPAEASPALPSAHRARSECDARQNVNFSQNSRSFPGVIRP